MNGNTSPPDGNSEVLVEDGMLPRFGIVTWDAVDSDEFRSLRGASVRVYLALALFADKAQQSHPKQATIGAMTGLNRETVNRSIGELYRQGLLDRDVIRRGRVEMVRYTLIRPPSKRKGV